MLLFTNLYFNNFNFNWKLHCWLIVSKWNFVTVIILFPVCRINYRTCIFTPTSSPTTPLYGGADQSSSEWVSSNFNPGLLMESWRGKNSSGTANPGHTKTYIRFTVWHRILEQLHRIKKQKRDIIVLFAIIQ